METQNEGRREDTKDQRRHTGFAWWASALAFPPLVAPDSSSLCNSCVEAVESLDSLATLSVRSE